MTITKEQVLEQLRNIRDPQSGADIVSCGRVQHLAYCDGYANIRLGIVGGERVVAENLAAAVRRAVEAMGGEIKQVRVEFAQAPAAAAAPPPPPQRPQQAPAHAAPSAPAAPAALPNVRHIIAVGAGKGGVGKSTVAVNLAVGLYRRGLRVGLLDGDIYGPSAPTLLGLDTYNIHPTEHGFLPILVHGLKVMTIGKLVDADKPLIWRGPMAHGAFRQLAMQTEWGELDYLIVDLPPGTGDVPLTLAQLLQLTGAVIVCTPQKVAQDDAVRAAGMFRQLNVPVLGVVENMSYFIGDDGKEYDIFGRGGAAQMATRLGLPLLGTIPIHMELRVNSDAGNPTANFTGNPRLAAELDAMTQHLVDEVEKRSAEPHAPKLTIT